MVLKRKEKCEIPNFVKSFTDILGYLKIFTKALKNKYTE